MVTLMLYETGGWQCAAVTLLGVRVGVAQWRNSALVADGRRRCASPATWQQSGRARLIARQQCGEDATQDLLLLLPLLFLLAVPVQRVCRVSLFTCT